MKLRMTVMAAAGLLAAAAPACAAPVSGVAPKGIPVSRFLGADELRPELTLPPPPAPGSPAARAELAELVRIEKTRTPTQFARAARDARDATENVLAFQGVMGPAFDLQRLPATAKLFHDLRHEDKAAAKRSKAYFRRLRPWIVDPSLRTCPHGDDTARSSYPSGHATMAYAEGGILARLDPSKAQAILTRAADYAEHRLVCGAHFRRDIVAGQALGTALDVALMDKPAFRAEFDAARAELAAAHVTP